MLGVIPGLLQLKRSSSKQGAGRGLSCPAFSVPWPAQEKKPWPPTVGHVPPGLAQGAQANPSQVDHGQGTLDGPWLGRLTGLKTSKTGLRTSKRTQHWFVKQDECSLFSGEGSFPGPCLGTLQGVRGWSSSKEQTVAVGHRARPEILMSSLPANSTKRKQAGRGQAGRAGQCLWAHQGRLSVPRHLQRWLLAALLDAEWEVPPFGIQMPVPSLQDGRFSSGIHSSHEAGGRGTHRPETQPGWWQPCWRDLELGVLMEMAWRKHTTGAVGAEVCVHGARKELPLCLWVP